LGYTIAEELGFGGAKVVVNYVRSREPAEELAAKLSENGGEQAVAIGADVSDAGQAQRLIEETIGMYGRIDVLVNNAGIVVDRTLKKLTPEEWDKVVQVDLNSCFYTVKAALPYLLERASGHIVVMSSGAGLRPFPGAAAYSATKAAQAMFADALRHELGGTGVSLTTVFPGEIATSLLEHQPSGTMPDWYRGDEAAPPEELALRIVRAIERDRRELYWKAPVKGMAALHGLSPRWADRALRRLRGDSAAPRRD